MLKEILADRVSSYGIASDADRPRAAPVTVSCRGCDRELPVGHVWNGVCRPCADRRDIAAREQRAEQAARARGQRSYTLAVGALAVALGVAKVLFYMAANASS